MTAVSIRRAGSRKRPEFDVIAETISGRLRDPARLALSFAAFTETIADAAHGFN
jgi:hypothetical protein